MTLIKNITQLTLMIATSMTFAQVGINTTKPTAVFDVNGDARIRNMETCKDCHSLINSHGHCPRCDY